MSTAARPDRAAPAPHPRGLPRPGRTLVTTSAASVLAAAQGAWCVRVHDVASTADGVRVTARWGLESHGEAAGGAPVPRGAPL
ncbi:hypothetical protein [Streptomyces massasporeus]|uniref:hypothetical protein n=1 Tax=Streptomyces massasporeus TaxID=67324 RepID=UPI0033C4CB6E